MSDAAVERLAKIISDAPPVRNSGSGKEFRSRKPAFVLRLRLAEGWFSLFLLATVVYSTIWSVQSAGWVEHLNILSLTTALGLISGVAAAKQQRLTCWYIHIAVVIFSLLLAFWQTAGAFYQGSLEAFAQGIFHWYQTVRLGGTSDDDSIFLFFIVSLSFLLSYTSAWLVYYTRSPWLMIVANAVVLLINLSNLDASFILYLIIFLIAALLLLLRINLYESIQRWRKQGLRYADDLGWDVMQAGSLISIGILIFSWVMPWGYTDPTVAKLWSANDNPWVQIQNSWNRMFAVNGGSTPSNHGNFRDNMVLAGNPNLNHETVFYVQTNGDGTQYLDFVSYDNYDAQHSAWQLSPATKQAAKANTSLPSSALLTHQEKQTITVVNPPGEQQPYIGGAYSIGSLDMPGDVLFNNMTGEVIAWLGQNGNRLQPGMSYNVASFISSADEVTLRSVPMPANAPAPPSNEEETASPYVYSPAVLQIDTRLPGGLDPRIASLAAQITAKAPTMYDKVVAIQNYLRTHYTYDVDIKGPEGKEGVEWFLFESGNKGFCNYFASAMAVMARSLGIPARVVVGYTNGTNDDKRHQRVITGVDAHAWTQIYFAGYGWINFEPSASFAAFSRPSAGQFSSVSSTSVNSGSGGSANANKARILRDGLNEGDSGGDSGSDIQSSELLHQRISESIGGLILLLLFGSIVFAIWWQRLFRTYKPAMQLYGRICILANWAGIQLQPAQTPSEHIQELAIATPAEAVTLERLGDIYVREQWADPESTEHPRRSGEIDELPGLWKQLQPRLFLYVLKHPYFLRWIPDRIGGFLTRLWKRHRAKRLEDEEF